MSRIALAALCGIVAALATAGCSGKDVQQPVATTAITNVEKTSDEPIWISSPSRAFPDQAKNTFFGVGVGEAKRLPGVYLRRKSAIERGRAELAAQLRTFVAAVFKDYTEAAFTPKMETAESRSLTSNVQRSVIDETLVGAKTMEMWKDPTTGDYYALISLDMDGVARQLREKIKAVEKGKLRVAADKAHEELNDIIQKNRARVIK